ncbi:MAG: YbiU family protein, partial [Actinomycetales bacterium]
MTMVEEMVQQRDEAPRELPPLPTWESTPEDLKAATRTIKSALRRRIEASGRSVEQVFAVMEERVTQRVEEIEAALRNGENAWPVVEYADIESGRVSAADLALLQRRGCLVVRGHFPREHALGWDRDIVDYVDRNRFFETYQGPADD